MIILSKNTNIPLVINIGVGEKSYVTLQCIKCNGKNNMTILYNEGIFPIKKDKLWESMSGWK